MRAGKPLALLVYLGLAPGRRTDRDRMADLLWPGASSQDAHHSLRQILYRLRDATGDATLVSAAGTEILLQPRVRFDCLEGEGAAEREDWEHACALLRGNFLQGYSIPESREFEDWAESQRARFGSNRASAAAALAELRLTRGDASGAVSLAEELIVLQPFDDDAVHLLMRALVALDRRPKALGHFRAYVESLRTQLDDEPGAELACYARELEQRLNAHAGLSAHETPALAADPEAAPPAAAGAQPSQGDENPGTGTEIRAVSPLQPAGDRARWRRLEHRVRAITWAALALGALALAGIWEVIRNGAAWSRAEAVLMLVVHGDSGEHRLHRVPIHAADWDPRQPLVVDVRRRPDAWLTGDSPAVQSNLVSPLPDGSGWVVNRLAADSGDVELFEVRLDGAVRRLTHARGIDRDPSHAPDGSRIVFATQRFNPFGRFDLAVLNPRTAEVRPLLRSANSDEWPMWSPDGSRIAFLRRHSASDLQDLCVITQDGAHTRCWSGSESLDRSPELIGWADVRHVIIGLARRPHDVLALLDVTGGTVTTIAAGLRTPRLAPNGRWLLCQCFEPGYPPDTWFVFPVDRPRDRRPLRIDGLDGKTAALMWAPDSPRPPFVDSLEILPGPGQPIAGVPHQLAAHARDAAGVPSEPGALSWESSDSTIATVSASGLLLPRRVGIVRIRASGGGWRVASAAISVREPATRLVIAEQWEAGFGTAWRAFGTPWPQLQHGGAGESSIAILAPGAYPSGVYLRQGLSPGDGITAEVELSVVADRPDVQALWMALTSSPDASMLDGWNHTTGFPQPHGQLRAQCVAGVPRGRLARESGDSLFLVGTSSTTTPGPPDLRHGVPHKFRLQIFPDGWCGIAVDGRPVVALPSGATTPAFPPLRLFVYGTADNAAIHLHRVNVWTGVLPDIDWAAVRPSTRVPSRFEHHH